MKFLKTLLIILGVLIVIYLVVSLVLPNSIEVEKTTRYYGKPDAAYAQVDNVKHWTRWSPWYKQDTTQKMIYSDKLAGSGAYYTWESEKSDLGSGKLTILESVPYETIKTEIEMNGNKIGNGSWKFVEVGDTTVVTWKMTGDLPFFFRVMGPWMKQTMEKKFESGLADLKEISEEAAEGPDVTMSIVDNPPTPYLYVSESLSMDYQLIQDAFEKDYGAIMAFVNSNEGINIAGPPFAVTTSHTDTSWTFEAGMPIAGEFDSAELPENIEIGTLHEGKVVKAVYTGSYDEMHSVYEKIIKFIDSHGFDIAGRSWEQYMTDPEKVAPDENVTHIFFPIKSKEIAKEEE